MKASYIGFNEEYSEDAPTFDDVSEQLGDVVLEFGAPWCEHCQAARSAIKAELENRSLLHIKVYDGKGQKLGRMFKVKLWPTLILLHDGNEVSRVVRPRTTKDVNVLFDKENGN